MSCVWSCKVQFRLSASWFIQGAGWTSGTRKVLLQDMMIMRLPGMRFEVVKSFSRKGGNTLGKHHLHHFWFAEVLRSCFTVPNGQLSSWQPCQVREGKVSRYPSKGFHLFLYIRKHRGKTHGKASGIVTSLVILRL